MLPPSWKTEVQETIKETANAERHEWQTQHNDAAAKIAAEIKTLSDAQNTQTEQQSSDDKKDRAINIATLVLVLLTVIFTFLTWRTLSGQLVEMKSAGEQTQKLIDANAKLVEASMQQAVAATENAKIARENFVASERAWVGPRNAKINNAPVLDQDLKIIVEYGNTGREPAVETVYDTDIFTAGDSDAQEALNRINGFIADCKIMWKPDRASVVYPSVGLSAANYTLTATMEKSKIDADVISGEKIIFLSGCFSYKTTESIHRSWFCYFFKAGKTDLNNWNICATGNGAD